MATPLLSSQGLRPLCFDNGVYFQFAIGFTPNSDCNEFTIVVEKLPTQFKHHFPEMVTVTSQKINPTDIFTVTENRLGDCHLGNGNGNFQIRNSEHNLSGNGNGNFRKKKTSPKCFCSATSLTTMAIQIAARQKRSNEGTSGFDPPVQAVLHEGPSLSGISQIRKGTVDALNKTEWSTWKVKLLPPQGCPSRAL